MDGIPFDPKYWKRTARENTIDPDQTETKNAV